MSRREVVEALKDGDFSSGDASSNKMRHLQEENNNEVDALSKELVMGCIVDTIKRPPNICVENSVCEDSEEDKSPRIHHETEDAYLSEEFDEEPSDAEVDTVKTLEKEDVKSEVDNKPIVSKSRSSMSTRRGARSETRSNPGYGSLPVPQTRRINMSFTNNRLRDIERENHILLRKIMCARNTKSTAIPSTGGEIRKPAPPAAKRRTEQQRKIDYENLILLKKIQRAKSSSCSVRR